MYIVPFLLIVKSYLHFIYPRDFLPAGDASPVTTIPTKLRESPMENGDADGYHLSFLAAAGAAPGIYTLPLGLASAMENGDPFATCFLAGTLHQLLVTRVAGLQPRVMENAEGSRVPAARDAGRAPCLLPSDAGEG